MTQKRLSRRKVLPTGIQRERRLSEQWTENCLPIIIHSGQYNFISIVDVPSEEAMVKLLLEVGKWGRISTETLTGMPTELVYRAAVEM